MNEDENRSTVEAPNELITVADLAFELRVPMATIYGWRHRGTGPVGYRIGRHLRFRRGDVEAWMAARRDDAGVVA